MDMIEVEKEIARATQQLRAELAAEREKSETRRLALDAAVSSSCVLAAELAAAQATIEQMREEQAGEIARLREEAKLHEINYALERDDNRELREANAELLEWLRLVLDTRNAEARASSALANAQENFTDYDAEDEAHIKAMVAASEVERAARELIAKHGGKEE